MNIEKYNEANELMQDIDTLEYFLKNLYRIKDAEDVYLYTRDYAMPFIKRYRKEIIDMIEKFFTEKRSELEKEFEKI